jgi:hypothetical protein
MTMSNYYREIQAVEQIMQSVKITLQETQASKASVTNSRVYEVFVDGKHAGFVIKNIEAYTKSVVRWTYETHVTGAYLRQRHGESTRKQTVANLMRALYRAGYQF